VVQSIDGKPTESSNSLRNIIAAIYPGKTVPVELLRNGKRVTVNVKLASREESEGIARTPSPQQQGGQAAQQEDGRFIGMTVGALTPELRAQLGLQKGVQGVAVAQMEPRGQAAQEGLRVNDVIMEVNRNPVASVKDFSAHTKGLKTGDTALLLVMRDGSTFYRAVKVRK